MKLIDLRMDFGGGGGVAMSVGGQQQAGAPVPSSPLVFRHDTDSEKVSDIQFNPSPSLDKRFASGSESGVVTVISIYLFLTRF